MLSEGVSVRSLSAAQRHSLLGVLLIALAAAGIYLLFNTFDGRGYDYSPRWKTLERFGKPPVVSADQRHVTVTYMGGACDDHATADVDESSSRVKITIHVTENSEQDCPASGVFRTISVDLSSPLAHRTLVDGGTD